MFSWSLLTAYIFAVGTTLSLSLIGWAIGVRHEKKISHCLSQESTGMMLVGKGYDWVSLPISNQEASTLETLASRSGPLTIAFRNGETAILWSVTLNKT